MEEVIIAKSVLLELCSSFCSENSVNKISKACDFAIKYHEGQTRESGEPYVLHPFAVAGIVASFNLDTASIITAILHDTVEDTSASIEEIVKEFGQEIAKLVDGVTKLDKIEHVPDSIRQAENFRKLILAISEDIRVLIVKLADRTHNMRTIDHMTSEAKRKRISQQTLDIYAALAERIGMQKLKNELQDLAFKQLYPEAYQSIKKRLDYLKGKTNTDLITTIIDNLEELLTKQGLDVLVSGRQKLPYSIWHKMQKDSVNFEELSDIIAFRIIVDDIATCYQVLGIIHTNFHVIPDCFKDFISTPKSNGYQSLHTVVIGPLRKKIEIQIRTKAMHQVAEYGLAAHWLYKQNDKGLPIIEGKKYHWIQELLKILENSSDSDDLMENTKLQIYNDQVFCFTPNSKLINLPKGSTPVDFAYYLHTDIGNSCVGAKVNGRVVPLRYMLNNGDQVEIIRSESASPSPTWEQFVATGKARSEIKKLLKQKRNKEYLSLGENILKNILNKLLLKYNEELLENTALYFKKKSKEDLLIDIGTGTISSNEVISIMYPNYKGPSKFRKSIEYFKAKIKRRTSTTAEIPIKGLTPGIAIHLAGCCNPIPGDKIVGIVNGGKGVVVHTIDCENLENFSHAPERWLDITWDKDSLHNYHIGRIKLIALHEVGVFAKICNCIAAFEINITNVKIINRNIEFFEVIFDLQVKGTKQLSELLTTLKSLEIIHEAKRYKQ